MSKASVAHRRSTTDTCRQITKSKSIRSRSGGLRRADGISLVGFLFFILLAYGIYTLVFKPGSKTGSDEAAATGPIEPQIVIYTTPSCEPCDRAKTWMTQRRIAFEERNVETSVRYEDELKNYKSRIVPVIVVNGEPQYGFQSAYLDQALKNLNRPHSD